MHYDHRYFSEYVPAPSRADEVFDHIARELRVIRCQRPLPRLHQKLLTSGAQLFGVPMTRWASFPDASTLASTPPAIRRYLERLVAPDAMHDAREVIMDLLEIAETEQIACDLAKLHSVCPYAATAFLELRLGRAHRLLKAAVEHAPTEAARSELGDFDHLLAEMTRVRVAYLLRVIASDCAGQIHHPYCWDPIDNLEHAAAGGTLRIGTFIKRFPKEAALAEQAFDHYERTRSQKAAAEPDKTICVPEAASSSAAELPAKTAAAFRRLNLDERARVQRGLWCAEHGNNLEAHLDQSVGPMRRQLTKLERQVKDKAATCSPNAIAGNIDRTAADVRLLFAVEEALAWVASPPSNADEADEQTDGEVRLAARTGSPADPRSGMERVMTWLRDGHSGGEGFPVPRRHQLHAFIVSKLFLALRFVFLQDDEVLPTALRQMIDPTTGKITRVKTHQKVERMQGRRWTFTEYWDVLQSADIEKNVTREPGVPLAVALNADLAARRKAGELRNLNQDQLPLDAVLAMHTLGNGMRHSFVTP